MAAKAIREVQSLSIVASHLDEKHSGGLKLLQFASIQSLVDLDVVPEKHPWVNDGVSQGLYFIILSYLAIVNFPLIQLFVN